MARFRLSAEAAGGRECRSGDGERGELAMEGEGSGERRGETGGAKVSTEARMWSLLPEPVEDRNDGVGLFASGLGDLLIPMLR
jgi:hypothetical protein